MFRNGPHVHILPSKIKLLRLNGEGEKREKYGYGVIQDLLCGARAHNADFFSFWGEQGGVRIVCHISGGFLPPHNPIPAL